MQWLSQNWVWVLFFAAFIAMHLFGHGGHGSHGGHGGGRGSNLDDSSAKNKDGTQGTSRNRSDHQH